jgi:tetratricopeptide (TPR) repeat protein
MKRLNIKLALSLVIGLTVLCAGVHFLHAFQVNRNAQVVLEQAQALYEEGDLENAYLVAGRYFHLRGDEDSTGAKLLADIAYKAADVPNVTLRKIRRAFGEMERAVRIDREDNERRRRLLDLHVKYNQFTSALEHIGLLRDTSRFDPDLEIIAAKCYAVTGDFDQSTQICQKLIGYDPIENTFSDDAPGRDEVDAYVLLTSLYRERKAGSEAQADRVIEQMVAVNEKSSKAHLAAHEYWKRTRRAEQAKESLAIAYEIDPESPNVVLPMAGQAIEEKDFERAENLIQGALGTHSENPLLYRGMALIHLRRQKPAEAIEALKKGLEKLPESDVLLNTLLTLQFEQGDLDNAKQTFQRLKEIGFNDSLLSLYQAQFLVHEQKWQDAIDRLDLVRGKLIHDQQRVVQIDMLMAQCYQNLGNFEKALELYRGISSQTTSLTNADFGEAEILALTGKNADALRQFEAIATSIGEELPDKPQVWQRLLQLRKWDQMRQPKDKRDWSKVDELLGRIKEAGKLDPILLAILQADLLIKKEQHDAARALYAKALGQNPDNEALWAARITLELETAGTDAALRLAEHVPSALQERLVMLLVRASIFTRIEGEPGKAGLLSLEKDAEKLNDDERYRLFQTLAQEHRRRNDPEAHKRLLGVMMDQRPKDLFSRGLLFDLAREEGDIDTMQRVAGEVRRIAEPDSPVPELLDAVTTITKISLSHRAKATPDQTRFNLTADEKAELAEVRKTLEDAVKSNAAWGEPHKWLSDVYAMENNIEGMLEELRAAARLGPLEPTRTRRLHELLVAKGLNDEAQDLYKRLQSGTSKGTDWTQVFSLLQSKRVDEARQVLDTLEPKADASVAELVRYADARFRTGDLDKAESALRRAVEADGTFAPAWISLVNTLVVSNKRSEAEKVVDTAMSRLPPNDRDEVLAQCYEALSDPVRAERSYLQAVAAKPRDIVVNKMIANFYLRTTKSDRATKYLEAILKEGAAAQSDDDKKIVAWARRAKAVLIAADGSWQGFQQAEAIILENDEEIRKNGGEPTTADLLLRITLLAERTEPSSLRSALALFEELQNRQPLQVSEQAKLARLYERVGQWPKAKEMMQSILASRDPDPTHFLAYAQMLLRNGALNEVEVWLNRYDQVRKDAGSLSIRVTLRVRQKREQEAVDLIANWLGRPPWAAQPLQEAATLLQSLGQYAEAEKLWKAYVKLDPRATIVLAKCVGLYRDLDEAFSLLDASLKHNRPRDVMLVGMQILRARKGHAQDKHYVQLGRWYAAAREAEPANTELELALGEVREMRGELDKAEEIYRKALARDDLNPMQRATAANNLAFILSTQRKNPDESLKLMDEAMKVIGPGSDLLDTRGVVYLAADQPDKALADFQEAVLVPSAMKWVHLAFAQSALNEPELARASLKKAQEENLKREDLYEAEWVRYERLAGELGLL